MRFARKPTAFGGRWVWGAQTDTASDGVALGTTTPDDIALAAGVAPGTTAMRPSEAPGRGAAPRRMAVQSAAKSRGKRSGGQRAQCDHIGDTSSRIGCETKRADAVCRPAWRAALGISGVPPLVYIASNARNLACDASTLRGGIAPLLRGYAGARPTLAADPGRNRRRGSGQFRAA